MKNKKEIGELLSKTREGKGLDIEKIAVLLRIRKQYLIFLEEGNYKDMPGQAYIEGYLNMYATFLGIEHNIKKLQTEDILERTKFTAAKKHINDNWIVASLIAIFVLILLLLIFYRGMGRNKNTIIDHLQDENINLNFK